MRLAIPHAGRLWSDSVPAHFLSRDWPLHWASRSPPLLNTCKCWKRADSSTPKKPEEYAPAASKRPAFRCSSSGSAIVGRCGNNALIGWVICSPRTTSLLENQSVNHACGKSVDNNEWVGQLSGEGAGQLHINLIHAREIA